MIGMMPMRNASGDFTMQEYCGKPWRLVSYFANEGIAPTSSIPEGSMGGPACLVMPLVGGGMASGDDDAASVTMTGTGSALSGGAMIGTSTVTFSQSGSMSLTITLAGTATITVTADGMVLKLTIGLGGTATWVITGNASNLAMIVPFAGSSDFALSGTANLKGLLSLAGESTPFTTLSPENLARSVWQYLIEGVETAEEAIRLLTAVAAGNATDITTNPAFKSKSGATTRVAGTIVGGTRTVTTRVGT